MSSPLLDSNVYLHALTNDSNSAECTALLSAIEVGEIGAILDIVVLHELTYSIPKYLKGISKLDVARLLTRLIELPGIICDKLLFADTIYRWSKTPGLSFVDAYLSAYATRDSVSIFSKNVRELRGQGAFVPDPLPG